MKFITTAIITLSVFVVACSKNNDTPVVPTKANITGSVILYDESTNQSDKSGMKISVEGLTPAITATTDNNGKFTLADVPFGTYTLVYEKSGYGTYRNINVEHKNTGSSTVLTAIPSLGKVSSTTVTALDAQVSGDNVLINATTDPAGNSSNKRYLRFFFASAANVSNTTYNSFSAVYVAQINPYTYTVSKTDLTAMGFTSGSTVYVKAYGDSFWSNDYTDANGKKIFPNLNATSATATSFIVP